MNTSMTLIMAIAVIALPAPASAATTIDLSATDYAASAVTHAFAPGSYTVSLVAGLYTAWAPARSGYLADGKNNPGANWAGYYKYTVAGATSYVNPLGGARFGSADAALSAYAASGPLALTFTVPTAVTFAIADYPTSFRDNSGGVSLAITAVPEPATWGMMVLGFAATAVAMRARRVARVVLG